MTLTSTDRAQGAWLGQLTGDSLGSLVEFLSPGEIARRYPAGVRQLADGGTWNTLAGQPTDDSEMAILLADTLLTHGKYDHAAAHDAYKWWLASEPFDCGNTIASALQGHPVPHSQANGALMRISPLAIFGAGHLSRDTATHHDIATWAAVDAQITHPHPVCADVNILYCLAIADTIANNLTADDVYQRLLAWCETFNVDHSVQDATKRAADQPPADFMTHQGFVLIAWQSAVWHMLHAPAFEEGVVATVGRGGDTDTNAAIAGALLGAVHGATAIPSQWTSAVLHCTPTPESRRPRPQRLWPTQAVDVAHQLFVSGAL